MKEIDTGKSVVWPSWCYSDYILQNVFKKCTIDVKNELYVKREHNYSNLSRTAPHGKTSANQIIKSTSDCCTNRYHLKTKPLASPSSNYITTVGDKMLSERALLLSGYSNKNTIDSIQTNCEKSNTPPLSEISSTLQGTGLTITPTTTAAAAAAYIYLEKVKNERMSPRVTAAQLDSLKDVIMESSAAAAAAVAAAIVNSNNSNSNNNNNNNNNSSNASSNSSTLKNCNNSNNNNYVNSRIQNQITNNNSDELKTQSLTQTCRQPQEQEQSDQVQKQLQQHQQQQLSLHMNSNHVKKERLSPGTNGDLQTTLSRSRSTTPSSFRGTSPQQSVHSSPSEIIVPMHNLSTNLLNSIHQAAVSNRHSRLSASSPGSTSASSGLPADFSTRNYSDFMRSLAAKYNNTNPNDNLKRNTLFEATPNSATSQKKASGPTQKPSYAPLSSTSTNKEVSITTTPTLPPPPPLTTAAISPGESPLNHQTHQNKIATAVANAAAVCSSNVSPYMTSFLSSLPFSSGIFSPLIDMSSTQALITLARAAKENEIHNILSVSTQHSKRSATRDTPSPSPSINMALQQAAQFISPALLYSAQVQKQQLQQKEQQQVSKQSSPRLSNITSSNTSSSTTTKNNKNLGEKIHISPLDLSSQPSAAKRFKAESTSSQSSTDFRIHTTKTRRSSSSTATMSPSPPPHNENPLNASVIVTGPTAAASAIVGSSTKTEATTAFTPIKVASLTSATPFVKPAVTVRQCQAQSEEFNSWSVDDVCAFVGSIDICAKYVNHFRDQCIDGSGLPLLTEDHLVNSLGMKLGPALKLRSVLAKKLGGPCPCVVCVAQVQQILALQTGGITATTAAVDTTNDYTTGGVTTNVEATACTTNRSGICNSNLLLSNNCSNKNNTANKNESTSTTTCSTNTISSKSTTSNVSSSDVKETAPRSTSNCITNVSNISSTLPASIAVSQQQQQHLQQEEPSPSPNFCSSKNDNSNPATSSHDNVDSSS